jgi:hypothetical protein
MNKIKNIILLFVLFCTCCVNYNYAQVVETIFNGYLSPVAQTGGSAPNFNFQAIYRNDNLDIAGFDTTGFIGNTYIIAANDGKCYQLPLTSLNTPSSNLSDSELITGTINDPSGELAAIPSGILAIYRETNTRSLQPYISGVPDALNACMTTLNVLKLDTISGGSGGPTIFNGGTWPTNEVPNGTILRSNDGAQIRFTDEVRISGAAGVALDGFVYLPNLSASPGEKIDLATNEFGLVVPADDVNIPEDNDIFYNSVPLGDSYSLPLDTLNKYNEFDINISAISGDVMLTLPDINDAALNGKKIHVRYQSTGSNNVVVTNSMLRSFNCSNDVATTVSDTLTNDIGVVTYHVKFNDRYQRYCTSSLTYDYYTGTTDVNGIFTIPNPTGNMNSAPIITSVAEGTVGSHTPLIYQIVDITDALITVVVHRVDTGAAWASSNYKAYITFVD